MGESARWRVSGLTDPRIFFKALPILVEGKSSIIAIQAPAGAEVRAFLEKHPAPEATAVELGTIWPKPQVFHLDITKDHLQTLVELSERHAEPELASHLHVYSGDQIIVEWYDAFSDPLRVGPTVEEDTVRAFCDATRSTFERLGLGEEE